MKNIIISLIILNVILFSILFKNDVSAILIIIGLAILNIIFTIIVEKKKGK